MQLLNSEMDREVVAFITETQQEISSGSRLIDTDSNNNVFYETDG